MKKLLLILLGMLMATDAFAYVGLQSCGDVSGKWKVQGSPISTPGTLTVVQTGTPPNQSITGSLYWACWYTPTEYTYYTYNIDSNASAMVGEGQWTIAFEEQMGLPPACQSVGSWSVYIPLGTPGCAAGWGTASANFPTTPLFLQIGGPNGESAPFCAVPSGENESTPNWDAGTGTGVGLFPTTLQSPGEGGFPGDYNYAGRSVRALQSPHSNNGCVPQVATDVPSPSDITYVDSSNSVTVAEGWTEVGFEVPTNPGDIRIQTQAKNLPCSGSNTETMQIDCLGNSSTGASTWVTYKTLTPIFTVNGSITSNSGGAPNTIVIARGDEELAPLRYGASALGGMFGLGMCLYNGVCL